MALGLGHAAAAGLAWGWWTRPLDAPFGFVRGDDWDVQLSSLEAVARSWSLGLRPRWNPWVGAGSPLTVNPEAMVLHPTGLLAAALPLELALRLHVLGHLALMGAGMAVLARRLGAGWGGAGLAVAGLLCTDALAMRLAQGHLMMVQAAWVPWAALGLLGRGGPLPWALALAGAGLGGAPQLVWFVALLGLLGQLCRWAAWAGLGPAAGLCLMGWALGAGQAGALAWGPLLGLLGLRWRSPLAPAPAWRGLLGGLLLGALLLAPRWLPAALFGAESERLRWPSPPEANAVASGIELLSSLFLHGSGLLSALRVEGLHNGQPAFYGPWLALLALAGARRRPALGLLCLLLLACSFAQNLPVNLWAALRPLPPLDRFRHPERLSLLWAPLLCILAGLGWSKMGAGRLLLAPALALALWRSAAEVGQHCAVEVGLQALPPRLPWAPAPSSAEEGSGLELARRGLACASCQDSLQIPPPTGPRPELEGCPALRQVEEEPGRLILEASRPFRCALPVAAASGWRGGVRGLGREGGWLVVEGEPGRAALRWQAPGEGMGDLLGLLGLCGLAWLLGRGISRDDPDGARGVG